MTPAERRESKVPEAKGPTEFLVLAVMSDLKPGSSLRLLGSATTMEKAVQLVDGLESSDPPRVAIVERRALLARRPQIALVPVDERILNPKQPGE